MGEYAATTDLPEVVPPCQVSLRGRGLPHQCAHWFAMTCRRRGRVSRCKDVPPLSLRGAKRRGNPYSLRQHVAEGSTLGECGKVLRICPKWCQLAGFLCGVTDCHTSAIQAAHPSPRLFRRKARSQSLRCIAFSGPHRCAPVPILHWFAMTCRRRGRGYVCKDVSAMDTLGRGRGLPHLVAPKSAMSSPQSPPCPAPAKGQSRATLPWGSSPRKGCPFAGPPALVRNDMQKTEACQQVQGRPPSVIARSEATWQSASPAAAQAKRNTLGEYGKRYGFARSSTNLSGFSAGKRIAAPVCALVRNDMQKAGAWLRL